MPPKIQLSAGNVFHIFNRGNNRQLIFRQEENYLYFLRLAKKHILPVADIYAYALLPDHFHLLIKIKEEKELEELGISEAVQLSKKFSNWFNAYAKAFNKKYNQVSSLFENRFERVLVKTEERFTHYVFYLHWNPQKHGHVTNYMDWPYSSYQSFLSEKPSDLKRDEILEWFGGIDFFIKSHESWINNADWEVDDY
jgi:putative transposase